MADYAATARTNYFRVKDVDAFLLDVHRHGISTSDWRGWGSLIVDGGSDNRPEGAIGLFSNDDHGTWPFVQDADEARLIAGERGIACVSYEPLPDEGEGPGTEDEPLCDACRVAKSKHPEESIDPEEFYVDDITTLVARHLVDGDVAVFMEAGAEKMRYVGGHAFAINSKGETVSLSLDDIYQKAESLGTSITRAFQ